jgi:hypothetical protein
MRAPRATSARWPRASSGGILPDASNLATARRAVSADTPGPHSTISSSCSQCTAVIPHPGRGSPVTRRAPTWRVVPIGTRPPCHCGTDADLVTRWGRNPRVPRLTTIPGLGPFSAIVLVPELADIRRFPNVKRVASYVGLTPARAPPRGTPSRPCVNQDRNNRENAG